MRTGVLRWAHTYSCALFLNLNFFWLNLDLKRDVELLRLVCRDHEVLFCRNREALRRRFNGVISRRKSFEFVSPWLFVTAVAFWPFAPVAVTVACGMTAPVGSETWPRSVPTRVCAAKKLPALTGSTTRARRMQNFAASQTSSILLTLIGAAPAAASPPPRFHGDRSIAARLLLGEAERIGSTPLNNVIAVGWVSAVPCVVTIITASPFCKSASCTAGIRFNICWKSGGPPGREPPAPALDMG